MKVVRVVLLSVLIFSSLPAQDKKEELVVAKQTPAVLIQESKDNTKLKLALLAAVVTLATVKYSGHLGIAIAFDKLVMFLWNK